MSYDEKAEVSIDSEGTVLKCAKSGVDAAECGYTAGAKVCGKCGATPLQMKMVPMDEFDDLLEKADMLGDASKKKPVPNMNEMPAADAEDAIDGGADEELEDENGMPIKKKAKPVSDEEDMYDGGDDEAAEGDIMPMKKKKMSIVDGGSTSDGEGDQLDPAEEDPGQSMGNVNLDEMRKRRLQNMGQKSAEVGRNGYLCAIDRKVYGGGTGVCDDCPGGCVPERGMPGLLSVEGIAESMFSGKVLDSGYSSDADMFVVDVQAKDGRAVEVFVDGTTAEVLGWHKLDDSSFEQKSALDSMMIIDYSEAADIAVKSIQGSVIAVEPDLFEGFDVYAVEIEGVDGKSYDVFVSLDGEVLGYDKYEPEEAEDIEAEAAEIALKRAFSEDERTKLADAGDAMPDGSFPIKSENDLKNAISAFGRAKDKEAAKRHIMKRAQALGMEKMIPAAWVTGGAKVVEEKTGETSDEFMASLLEFELLNDEVNNSDSE
jgi:uncharacterized membrane protein YkoI